jgi:sec-independent protein translocase protein TatA
MFSMPAGSEWLIVLVLVLIFFGVGRLPDVLKQLGKGVRSFKEAAAGDDEGETPVRKAEKEPKRLPAGDDLDEEHSKSATSTRERQS